MYLHDVINHMKSEKISKVIVVLITAWLKLREGVRLLLVIVYWYHLNGKQNVYFIEWMKGI